MAGVTATNESIKAHRMVRGAGVVVVEADDGENEKAFAASVEIIQVQHLVVVWATWLGCLPLHLEINDRD